MMDVVKRYGFSGSLRLFRDVIFTRIFFSSSRLVRFPVFIRGRKYIDLGKGLTTGVNLRLDAFPENINTSERTLIIGNNVQINDYCHIGAVKRVTIGNNVLIASKVYISDHNHGSYKGINQSSPLVAPGERELSVDPVIIEDNVWLGESVVVLPGVTIGRGSIVGAASVVTKSIPPDSIAVGSPAKVVKKFNSSTNTWDNI